MPPFLLDGLHGAFMAGDVYLLLELALDIGFLEILVEIASLLNILLKGAAVFAGGSGELVSRYLDSVKS